ncbi:MAG: sensor histidine kinase [Catonella sp.]
MRNKLKKIFPNKIRNQLFVVYILTFTAIIIIISTVLIALLSNLMIDKIGASRLDLLKQIGERSNVVKNSSITISNLYKLNSSLISALTGKLDATREKKIKVNLDDMKKNFDVVFSEVGIAFDVIVIGDNGFCYSSQAGDNYDFASLKNQLWYKSIFGKKDDITFISSFKDVFGVGKKQYVFSASRRILNSDGNEVGTLLINIDEVYLSDIYQSALNGTNVIYIIDSNGNIISHTNKDMRGMNFINVENFKKLYGENDFRLTKKSVGEYLISNYHDTQTGWTIIEEMPSSFVLSDVYRAYIIISIIIGICFLISLIISYLVAGKVSKPLLDLCDSLNQVKEGNFDVVSKVAGYDEINLLKSSFNGMAQEIKKLLEDIKNKEAYKRRIENDLLRAQINPHFLYNTLFSIKCLAETRRPEEVSEMISALIDFLKMTLRKDADLICLSEEFIITEKYLVLQQMRYGDKLSFEFEPDEKTTQCMVPALILQPIVENAIFHGIEAKNEMGIIVISSEIQNERLIISISDDGAGMNEDTLERVIDTCTNKEYTRNESIGIANVSGRIKVDFGNEYGLHIESEAGIGTTVTIELPIIDKKLRTINDENFDC